MLCSLIFSWWRRKTLCLHYLTGGLSWLSRLFRTVQLIFCNLVRNLVENINYTCRLYLYETVWRETLSAGQTYQNKSKLSVLKLSVGSFTSPENWQTLKENFFGIRQHHHNEFCSRFFRFPTVKCAMGMFQIYVLLALIRFQCTWKRIQINYKIITPWKLFSPSEIYGSSICPSEKFNAINIWTMKLQTK
jgi:hypothetical protein